MHPSFAPMDFMRDIKVSSSLWMKSSNLFTAFNGWSVGYGFEEEYRILLLEYGITPDERFFP
jgi:hypothetical protein